MKDLNRKQPPVLPVGRVEIPDVRAVSLNNGVPVYFIDAGTEDIMRIEIIFRAGQVKENLPLVSSTANMMLSEGTASRNSEELNRLLDYYGAFLNLSPEKDLAGVVLYFLGKHASSILELAAEMIFTPLFPEAELSSLMNKRLRWFLVNREKVSSYASDIFFESIFGKSHPYGRIIDEKDFNMHDPAVIGEFHSRYYTPGNMTIIISGKIDQGTAGLLNRYFGGVTLAKGEQDEEGKPIIGEKTREVHIGKKGAVQTAIRVGSATINKRHPDYPGLKIFNTLLGGYFGSRLMKNIREEKGLTYGISSTVSSLDLSGYKVISTEVSPKNCDRVIDEILHEIRLLQTVPVGNDELAVLRNYMSGEMVRMFDGPFAIAESFRSAWEFGLDINYFHRLSEKILKISPDEIMQLARTYYNTDDLYKVTVGLK